MKSTREVYNSKFYKRSLQFKMKSTQKVYNSKTKPTVDNNSKINVYISTMMSTLKYTDRKQKMD